MLINSIVFWIFFGIILLPYYTVLRKSYKYQNLWLLLGSYFFYGWANIKMAILLLVVTVVFYFIGNFIAKNNRDNPKIAARLTKLGVILGLLLLGYFKYLNFFIESFSALFRTIGFQINDSTFNIIMPIGISFFTFKLISYVVDIRKQKVEAVKELIAFGTYVAFFPTIMSGPIDRPKEFMRQLFSCRCINYEDVSEGLKKVLWGLFTKICIADVLVSYTDAVFDNLSQHSGISIAFATILYSVQIYADFNGYSNMAIGTAQILGLRISENFLRPYFASSISDFWRRWHMSLSSWIRDYIYIPLGGNRKGVLRMYMNQMVAMILCGMWHGAAFNFIVWGALHGGGVCVHKFYSQVILKHSRHYQPVGLKRFFSIVFTFLIVSFVWQFFRINKLQDYAIILSQTAKGPGRLFLMDPQVFTFGILSTLLMMIKDFKDEHTCSLYFMHSKYLFIRILSIAFISAYIILFGALEGRTFIYFQF